MPASGSSRPPQASAQFSSVTLSCSCGWREGSQGDMPTLPAAVRLSSKQPTIVSWRQSGGGGGAGGRGSSPASTVSARRLYPLSFGWQFPQACLSHHQPQGWYDFAVSSVQPACGICVFHCAVPPMPAKTSIGVVVRFARLQKTTFLSTVFYVCPEPVMWQIFGFYNKMAQKRPFSHRPISGRRMGSIELMMVWFG
jgi:hypothetical protein